MHFMHFCTICACCNCYPNNLRFVLSRKYINIYKDVAGKYGNVTVKDFRKYEKIEY